MILCADLYPITNTTSSDVSWFDRDECAWAPCYTTTTSAPKSLNSVLPTLGTVSASLPLPHTSTPLSFHPKPSPITRTTPSDLNVLSTTYNPSSKTNKTCIASADHPTNHSRTIEEQRLAEQGEVVTDFETLQAKVSQRIATP